MELKYDIAQYNRVDNRKISMDSCYTGLSSCRRRRRWEAKRRFDRRSVQVSGTRQMVHPHKRSSA